MTISLLSSNNEKQYSDFIRNSSKSTIYHTLEWRDVLKSSFGFNPLTLVAENDNGVVTGSLPLFLCETAFGRSLISSPFFIFGGIISDDDNVTSALISKAKEISKEHKTKQLLIKQRNELSPTLVESHSLKRVVHEHTFYLKLDKDPQSVLKKLPKGSVRWGIKKAKNSGVSVRYGITEPDLKEFYHLFIMTRKNIGVPSYPYKMFKEIWERFHQSNNVKLLLADYKNETVAAIMVYLYNGMMSYAHAAAKPRKDTLSAQPYHALLWEAIEHACENDFKVFDLHGASPQMKGLYDFKKRWADETAELPYYYYPNTTPYNDPEDERFKLIRKIWKTLPLPLTKTLSPIVIRHMVR
jgi:CelD/BcsL family acetyltransferase involved in cellulose biosynthesis